MIPAQWTGRLIGEIHNAGFSIKQVSEEAGLNPKYVSAVLNRNAEAPKAESKLRAALERLAARSDANTQEES